MFDRAAASYENVGPTFFSHFGRRIVDLLSLAQGAKVLDVACGAGASLLPAAQLVGASGLAVGVDLACTMLYRARHEIGHRGFSNARVICMNATALAFPNCMFDAILCGFALNRFSSPALALEEFSRVLRPQGRLGVVLSEGWWWQGDDRWQWHADLIESLGIRVDFRPRQFPTTDDLSNTLIDRQFAHISIVSEKYDLVFADADEWWDWNWSQGYREVMEGMSPSQLERYRAASFEHLQGGPVRGHLNVILATATKSDERMQNTYSNQKGSTLTQAIFGQ